MKKEQDYKYWNWWNSLTEKEQYDRIEYLYCQEDLGIIEFEVEDEKKKINR